MAVNTACFRQCYFLCLATLTEEAGPLSIAICAMGCYWACGGDPASAANTPDSGAQADGPTVVADTGQDPNPPMPVAPEVTAELDPLAPSTDTGTIGDAPVDGTPTDNFGSDWGGSGTADGSGVGDDGGPNPDNSLDTPPED